jgi:hypothetical protein
MSHFEKDPPRPFDQDNPADPDAEVRAAGSTSRHDSRGFRGTAPAPGLEEGSAPAPDTDDATEWPDPQPDPEVEPSEPWNAGPPEGGEPDPGA